MISILGDDGSIFFLDVAAKNPQIKLEIANNGSSISAYDIECHGRYLAASTSDGYLLLYDMEITRQTAARAQERRRKEGLLDLGEHAQLRTRSGLLDSFTDNVEPTAESQPEHSRPVPSKLIDSLFGAKLPKRANCTPMPFHEATATTGFTRTRPPSAKRGPFSITTKEMNTTDLPTLPEKIRTRRKSPLARPLGQLTAQEIEVNRKRLVGSLKCNGMYPKKLKEQYPLQDGRIFRRLYRILSAIVYWCPAFGEVSYLPAIVYPFVKIFRENDLAAFEASVSVLLHWCGDFLVSLPYPPVFAMRAIEKELAQRDAQLYEHFTQYQVSSEAYAWSLLKTIFTEVMSDDEWMCLWDHLFTFSDIPQLLYVAVLAYLSYFRTALLAACDRFSIEQFFHQQNAIDIQKFLQLMMNLREKLDLSEFTAFGDPVDDSSSQGRGPYWPLSKGQYPAFAHYPRFVVDFQISERNRIALEEAELAHKQTLLDQIEKESGKLKAEHERWMKERKLVIQAEERRRKEAIAAEKERILHMKTLDYETRKRRLQHLSNMEASAHETLEEAFKMLQTEYQRLEDTLAMQKERMEFEISSRKQEEELQRVEFETHDRVLGIHKQREMEERLSRLRTEFETRVKQQELQDMLKFKSWKREDEEQERKAKLQLRRREERALLSQEKRVRQELENQLLDQQLAKDKELLELESARLARRKEQQGYYDLDHELNTDTDHVSVRERIKKSTVQAPTTEDRTSLHHTEEFNPRAVTSRTELRDHRYQRDLDENSGSDREETPRRWNIPDSDDAQSGSSVLNESPPRTPDNASNKINAHTPPLQAPLSSESSMSFASASMRRTMAEMSLLEKALGNVSSSMSSNSSHTGQSVERHGRDEMDEAAVSEASSTRSDRVRRFERQSVRSDDQRGSFQQFDQESSAQAAREVSPLQHEDMSTPKFSRVYDEPISSAQAGQEYVREDREKVPLSRSAHSEVQDREMTSLLDARERLRPQEEEKPSTPPASNNFLEVRDDEVSSPGSRGYSHSQEPASTTPAHAGLEASTTSHHVDAASPAMALQEEEEDSGSDSDEFPGVMDAMQRPIAELEKKLGIRFDDFSDEEKEEEDSFDVRHDSEEDEDETIEDDRAKLLQRAKRLLELSSFDSDSDEDFKSGVDTSSSSLHAPPCVGRAVSARGVNPEPRMPFDRFARGRGNPHTERDRKGVCPRGPSLLHSALARGMEKPSAESPALRKTASLPAYDLALRRDGDGDDSDANSSARVASVAEEEDVVSLASASELSLRGDAASASAPSAATPLEAALSASPSSATSSDGTAARQDLEPEDTVPQLPSVGSSRSVPTLERSHTSSELIGLRSRERQTAESAYSSPSSGSAPSFEIESVTLPTDGVTETDIDKTTHTVFAVEVKLQGGLQWLIRKRYSDFRELHERLKRTSSPVKQLYFPKRHVFRNRHQSVVEQRRSELEKYINEVLDIRPLIRVPLFNFLEVYAHMESYERKLQRHKKELESERMKNMLPPELLEDFSTAFKRLCSSKYLYHGNTSGHKTEAESSRGSTSSSAPTSSGAPSGRPPTSPVKEVTTTSANGSEPSKGSTTDERGNRHSVIMHTAGSQICISRASFRRDILGVFPDMPSSFAMRFMKAVSDRQGSDINMDEFLRAVAILRCGTMEDQLQFIFNMCDLDHAGKVQSTGLSNFLVSLHGRHVLDRPEYRRLLSEGFDQGRVRMSCDEFIKIVPELKAYHTLVDWMAPFADILCETANPQLLESQEEFNPAVQQKILANETHFNAKEVSVLQDAFNNYRASGGGDAVDLDALTSDFPLEMSEERFCRVFCSFGSRANGSDIDVFSFVSALSIACRGTTQEKSEFAFKLFASVGDGSYMTREDIYGMLRLDITLNPELESQITSLIDKKHLTLNATKSSSSSSLIESMGARTPSVSGSELGIFVDGIMKGFGHRRSVWDASSSSKQTEALTLTLKEFTKWAIKQKYEMATLRIMREVAFIDLGLVPATKEEELLIATGCYNPYDPATLVEDDRWYLIERKWYIHWCRYIKIHVKESLLLSPPVANPTTTATSTPSTSKVQVNGGSTANKDNYMKNLKGEIVRPKCINNYPLLTSDRRDRILKTSDDIKLGRHYVIICEQLWMALKLWYGGGPEIQRQVVVAGNGEPILDIWEAETKKKLAKKKSKGKEAETDDQKEEGEDGDAEDDSSSVPSEEEIRRRQELALPRRMRSGGSVGLANLGNTCYMNSALQCLTNTKLLAEYFLSGMYLEDINRTSTLGLQGKLAEVYGKLAEDMWCVKQKSISPRNFKKSIGKFNEVFRGNDQQDAQELLAFLLSGLSEDLNRIQDKPYIEQPDSDGRYDADLADEWWRNHLRREVSIIVALFTGQYKSLLTCSVCGFKSARFEPFTFLQVPLPEPKHNTVTVQLVLANGVTPIKVSVRLSISATIFDLKHELMKMCHDEFDLPDVSESDIKLCEFSGSMILSFKADNRRVGQIRSIDRLIAFQLEPLDSETVQATRHRRPSYVQAVGTGGIRSEEADHSSFYEELTKGALVDVRMRTQSHEYIPAVVLEPPTAHADYEDQPVVLVRLRRTEDEIKVPLNRLRPRQARLLYIPLLSRKLSYSAVYFKNPFRPVSFGSPNLVRLCPELTTGLHLYQLVWERVKQYVGPDAKPPTEWEEEDARNANCLVANHIDGVFAGLNDASARFSSNCGFLLRRVENKGLTDSRSSWLTRSFGFTIPCTSEPLDLLEEEAIAIDWDLSVFQDREMMDKMKHVENHDSVARNEEIDKGPVPLRHCLDAFTSEEKISEGYCSSCRQHQEMTKKLEIWRLPPVMVVHLKRFQYTQTYRRKLASLVEFPIHDLDLSCCVAPHIEIPDKYPMKRPKSTSSGVSTPARKLIKLRSRGESTASNGSKAQISVVDEAANDMTADVEKRADGELDEGEKPEDSELPAQPATTEGVSVEGDGESSPDTKAGSNATTDTETTSTSTSDSQRAAAAQAAAVRNRVRRGYTNSNLDQSRCLETKYNLYGVVNHQGALGGGHYTAYARNFVDDQWYYYDDERVRVVEEQQVVSPSAYLLFYLRSDMDDVLVKDLFPKNMKAGKITDEDIERFVEEGDERRCSIM
ncbi:unnamed protein product [Phytophthora lilii]|uniref:ubiquitinyl hydrolase 1 n=1 Tax=Phytophthora lilii TaxID=2077276 RepID=A0A9W6U167_9STRA|nr:unnamed protein product [Phytophthora lilii]